MSNSLGEAVLDLTADDSQMVADIEGAKKNALAKMEELGTSMKRIGQTMSLAFTLPLIAAGTTAFGMAADYEDALGATDQIYKDSSETVKNWANDLETYYGIAKNEALQYANMMGSMLKNIGGLTEEEAASQSSVLIELAGDLAAMYGGTTADAVHALTGALKGNNTMLDNYGMVATDSMIKAKAFELGLSDGTGELSAQAKQAATLALIMEQSAAAQGQAAREADGASGSLRAQTTEIKNLAIDIGTMLLPIGIQLLTWIRDLVTWIQTLNPEQQKWLLILGAVVAAAGPVLMIVGGLITAFTAIAGAVAAITSPMLIVAAVIAAVAAAAYLLYLAWTNNWGGIQEKMAAVWAWLQPILMQIWTWLSTNFTTALQNLAFFWSMVLLPAIMAVWNWMSAVLFPFLMALANFIGTVIGLALTAFAGIWQNVLMPALQAVFSILSAQLMPIFQALAAFWQSVLLPIIQQLANWIKGALVNAFNSLTNTLRTVTTWLNKVAGILGSIKLPSWMTPGSPTPWEIGLLGVNDALKKVSGIGLPNLNSSLTMMPAPAMAGMSGFGSGGGSAANIQFVYQPFIGVNDEYAAEEKLRGIIERVNRKTVNK